MATFTGTTANESIRPGAVSATVTVSGGLEPGADADIIDAGGGNDRVEGAGGADRIDLGDGDDSYYWRVGDGNDIVDAGAGTSDAAFLTGNSTSETVSFFDSGGQTRFTRAIGTGITLTNFEFARYHALGGEDRFTLTGLDLAAIQINLGATTSTVGEGDGAVDQVTRNYSEGVDTIEVRDSGSTGLEAVSSGDLLTIFRPDSNDILTINALGGNDTIDASALPLADSFSARIHLVLDGGAGNDIILGAAGRQTLIGGGGDDRIDADRDIVDMGDGNDTLNVNLTGQVDADGGAGFDVANLQIGGTAISSLYGRADGSVRLSTFDATGGNFDNMESFHFGARPDGSNNFSIYDLVGTSVADLSIDLNSAQNARVGLYLDDDPTVDGVDDSTSTDNILIVRRVGAALVVEGLATTFSMTEMARHHQLVLSGGKGADRFDASALGSLDPILSLSGGDDGDHFILGLGRESISGDDGFGAPQSANDLVDYGGSARGVTVDLANGRGYGGWAQGDTYVRVDDVTGSAFADVLIGDDFGNELAGGVGADELHGGAGIDMLDGGVGLDFLAGGTDSDTYRVDRAGDQVIEYAGEGVSDEIRTTVSYALAAGVDVERLVADTLTAPINLSGNEIDNILVGNAGANALNGGGGADRLIGGDGNDVLNGGAGADRGEGGRGNDLYHVNSGADSVVELAGEGFDRVTTTTHYRLAAGISVERLDAGGTSALNLVGNEIGNLLVGNDAANTLEGKGGRDRLVGSGGADRFLFVDAADAGNGTARDTIADFEGAGVAGGDRIWLSQIDAIEGGEDDAFSVIGSAAFTAAGQLRIFYVESANLTIVAGNTDADLTAEFQIALVGDQTALAALDFVL